MAGVPGVPSPVDIKTLAQLKRLAQAGATFTLVEGPPSPLTGKPHRALNVPRTVAKYGPSVVRFSDGCYLTWGPASEWTFDGNRATNTSFVTLVYAITP